jgi:hypothetical protein
MVFFNLLTSIVGFLGAGLVAAGLVAADLAANPSRTFHTKVTRTHTRIAPKSHKNHGSTLIAMGNNRSTVYFK